MLREETKKILDEYNIRLDKEQGQSHLVDEGVLKRIVDYGQISSSDVVLEIGPGIGNLTSFLVERAARVIAVEKDVRLARILRERFRDESNLRIKNKDVLNIDLPDFDKVVSNLPYSISSPITFKLLERGFDTGVLTYQKEFAERLTAEPGSPNYSRLTVNVYYQGEAEILEDIPRSAFIPEPEVRSSIIRIKTRENPFEVNNEKRFLSTVRGAFQHRRQKIRNSLYHSFEEIFPEISAAKKEKREIIDNSIPDELANARAGEIPPEKFAAIADSLEEAAD